MMETMAKQNRRKRHVPYYYYYEDDVVEYTNRGKVKIPKKYGKNCVRKKISG